MNPPTSTFASHLSKLSSSRRKGLTAIISKAQGRVLPESSGWMNPEESIGVYIGRDTWTRFKFWEVIGPARVAFDDIAPKIGKLLENTVDTVFSRVSWSMYMIGRAPSKASPSIIICSEIVWDRRHVRDIIKASGILEDYPPGIKTGHLPRLPGINPLVTMGVKDKSLYNQGAMIALAAHASSACGSQICESASETHMVAPTAVGTVGGVIRLGTNHYYMTAAHTISSDTNLTAEDDEGPAEDPYGSALSLDGNDDSCIGSDSNVSTDHLSIWHSPSRVSERSDENRYLRDDIVRQWSLKKYHEAEEPLFPLSDSGTMSLVRTETPFMTSMDIGYQATGLDYALLKIRPSHHSVENVVKVGQEHQATVKVHSFMRSVPRDMDVVAITSRGAIKGRISATPIYSSAPGQRAYNRMFKVTLGSAMQKGDCGTWVVDITNGHLIGHVVLGSPGGNFALIIPFADVFDDILSRTGRSPIFPGTEEDGSANLAKTRTLRNPRDLANAATILERLSDFSGAMEDPEALSKLTVPERSEMAQASTSRTILNTLPQAVHGSSAPQGKSDRSEMIEKASNGTGRLMEREILEPRQRRDTGRAPSKPSPTSHTSLPGNSAREEGPAVLTHRSQPRSPDRRHSKPLKAPAPFRSAKFRDVLLTFSKAPLQWENTELLEIALKEINLDAVATEAEEESQGFIFAARSRGGDLKPKWGYQDCVIRALSSYFRRSFFTRIKKPSCETCQTKLPTIPRGHARPTLEEKAGKAQVVELYQCPEKDCEAYTRFPRYWNPLTLLRNPRGRAGEAANCFGLLCRALGSRVRWVWNAEDRIWVEVYSEHQERWVHVDACEGSWDDPLIYTESMGKKLSYCIAFSVDGAVDVTPRYVRSSSNVLPRTKCSEEELLSILHDINNMRRREFSKGDLIRLEKEDTVEARELKSYLTPSDMPRKAGDSLLADVTVDSTMTLGPAGRE